MSNNWGALQTGIPLQTFIDTMYTGLPKNAVMYLFNDKDEITGATDSSILKDKLNIYDVLPHLKEIDAKPAKITVDTTSEGQYLLAPIELVKWHIAIFTEYTMKDRIKHATVPLIVVAGVLIVLLALLLTIFATVTQIRTLQEAVKELSSGNADLTKRVSVKGRSVFKVFDELVFEENKFIKKLQEIIATVKQSEEKLTSVGFTMSSSMENTASSISQIISSIDDVHGKLLYFA